MYPTLKLENNLRREGFKLICGIDEVGRGAWAGPIVAAAVILAPQRSRKLKGLRDSKLLNSVQREKFYKIIVKEAVAWSVAVVNEKKIDKIGIGRANERVVWLAIKKLDKQPDYVLIDGNVIARPKGRSSLLPCHCEEAEGRRGNPKHKLMEMSDSALPSSAGIATPATLRVGARNDKVGLLQCSALAITEKGAVPCEGIIRGDAKIFSIACASIIAKVTRDRLMDRYGKKFPEYGFGRHKGYGTARHQRMICKHGVCEIHRKSYRPIMKIFNSNHES